MQICVVELLAAVTALKTFRDDLRDQLVLFFVDSEPDEAALIKGHSAK